MQVAGTHICMCENPQSYACRCGAVTGWNWLRANQVQDKKFLVWVTESSPHACESGKKFNATESLWYKPVQRHSPVVVRPQLGVSSSQQSCKKHVPHDGN